MFFITMDHLTIGIRADDVRRSRIILSVRGDKMDDETHLAVEISMFIRMKMEWK